MFHQFISFLNPFVPSAPFMFPLKTPENLFQFSGSREGALGTNGLNSSGFSCLSGIIKDLGLLISFLIETPGI